MKIYPRIDTSRIQRWCSHFNPDALYSDLDSFRRFGDDLIYNLEINKNEGILLFYDEFEPMYLMAEYKVQLIDDEYRRIAQFDKIVDSWLQDVFPRLVRSGFVDSVVNLVDMLIDATCFLQLNELQIKFMDYRRTLPARKIELL